MVRKKARSRRIQRIEMDLKQQEQRVLADVVMRDMMVIGNEGLSSGEYAGLMHGSDKKKLRDEPEGALVSRMVEQIKIIANRAAGIHLADNFSGGDAKKMLPDKKNHVTRVSVNEFYFYPYRRRGPLSAAGFSALFESIGVMAGKLPENLHLILGSFPVVNEHHHVRNLVIHVQCGKKAALKVFAKMVPAENDLDYKATAMPTLFGQGSVIKLFEQASRLKNKIMTQLNEENPVLNSNKLKRLRRIFVLLGVKPESKALTMIDEWLAKPASDIVPSENFLLEVSKFNLSLIEALKAVAAVSDQEQKATLDRINQGDLSKQVLHHEEAGMPNIHYGGYVPCVTSGGAEFITMIDICLDHNYRIAKKAYSQAQKGAMPVLIPNIITQVVTSNTILLRGPSIIGESVVHADPVNCKIQVGSRAGTPWKNNNLSFEREEMIDSAKFGGDSSLLIYPARLLGRVGGKRGDTIGQFNAMSQALQLKLKLARRYSTQADIAQCVKDIKLRMAFLLKHFDQIEALMQEGADIAYQDEHGVSTLSLVSKSKKLFEFIGSKGRLLKYFNGVLSAGHQGNILQVFDEIVKFNLGHSLYSCFSKAMNHDLMYAFLRMAIRRQDEGLMVHLMKEGVDPFLVDGETGRSLFSEALTHDNTMHVPLRVIFSHILNHAHLTTSILIDALNDVDDLEKALRFYLLIALHRNDPEMFAQLIALGANYLGQDPTASRGIIKPIFNSDASIIKAIVFLDALNHHRLNEVMNVLMSGGFDFYGIIADLSRCFGENPGHESELLDLLRHLAKTNQYEFLECLRDDPRMAELSVEAQALVLRLLDDFDAFQYQVESGDLKNVAQSLANGVSPNVTLKRGVSVIFHAITSRDQALLACLLDAGVDLRLSGDPMHSPFACAVEQLNWPAVSLIYERIKLTSDNPSFFNKDMIAKIEFKINEEIMDMVNMNGDQPDVWNDANIMMHVAKQMGVAPNFKQAIFGMTPLSRAIDLRNVVTIAWLLENGAPLEGVKKAHLPLVSAAKALLRPEKAASILNKKQGHAGAATSLWAPVKQEKNAPIIDYQRPKKDKR